VVVALGYLPGRRHPPRDMAIRFVGATDASIVSLSIVCVHARIVTRQSSRDAALSKVHEV
jgi:hypothetical protein